MRSALIIGFVSVFAGVTPSAGSVGADTPPVPSGTIRRLTDVVSTRSLDALRADLETIAARAHEARETSLVEATVEPVQVEVIRIVTPNARERIAARCPDIHDSELLRDGAAPDGLGLCQRSVHAARTDVSAAAIVKGFGLLGLAYSRGRRGQDAYDDCSSFIGRAYREAGRPLSDSDWEPSSSVMRNASWATVVDEARPGDILWRRGHVAIALSDGYLMHANQSGDVTHVEEIGRYSRVLAVDVPFA